MTRTVTLRFIHYFITDHSYLDCIQSICYFPIAVHQILASGHCEMDMLLRSRLEINNLKWAIIKGDLSQITTLLDRGCHVNAVDSDGSTLLHSAAQSGHVKVIRELVDRGCSVNAVKNNGCSPLHDAASNGRKEAVLELIHLGSNMSLVAGPHSTPLHQAVLNGHLETVVAMIEKGCPIDAVDSDGSTLLHFAAQGGHVEVIRELVDRGCNVNAVKNNRCSPLHDAARNGRKEAVLELIHLGSNMSLVAGHYGTPLHQAVLNGHLETVVAMIEEGCPIDAVDDNGFTLLHFASVGGDVEVIRELVDRGCNVNVVDNHGCSPLHFAAGNGRKKAVLELIHLGSNMSLVAGRFGTPLHQAVLHGHLDTVVAMIEEGCPIDVTVVDVNGSTVLHSAIAGGHLDIIGELVERGYNVRPASESIHSQTSYIEGLTPLEAAITSGEGCKLGHMCTTMKLFNEAKSIDQPDGLLPLCEGGFLNQNRLLCLAAIPGDSQFFDHFFSLSKKIVRASHYIDMKLFRKYFSEFIPETFPIEDLMLLNPFCIALFSLYCVNSNKIGNFCMNKKSRNHRQFIERLLSHPILKGTVNDVLSNGLRPLDLARQFGLGDIVKSLEKAGGQPGLWSMLPREIVTSHSSFVSKSFSGLLPIAQSGPMGLQAVKDILKVIYCHSTDPSGILSVKPDLADISKHVVPVVASKCYPMGVYLGIESTTVDIVKGDYGDKGCEEVCLRMFDRWLRVGLGTGDKERT